MVLSEINKQLKNKYIKNYGENEKKTYWSKIHTQNKKKEMRKNIRDDRLKIHNNFQPRWINIYRLKAKLVRYYM